jgi:hypothetical protein
MVGVMAAIPGKRENLLRETHNEQQLAPVYLTAAPSAIVYRKEPQTRDGGAPENV